MLLSALIVHGCITYDLSVSTILPVPKGKNLNYSSSDNYRAIALSSIIGKIFDIYILNRYNNLLISTCLQFGFKAGHSTSMCTMILKEALDYYRSNNSTVYCTMLDITKAFDRVEYCKLIRLLLYKKIPAIIVRILLHLYLSLFTSVEWNGARSDIFCVTNGVRQGAILSPILFCVYFDDLLHALSDNGSGCYIGTFFVGALAYADDLVLIAPSANAMRQMLQICDEYARNYKVKFNSYKSKCLRCHPTGSSKRPSNSVYCLPFQIGSHIIEFVDSWPHLGHIITSDCDDSVDISSKKTSFIGQVNKILCNFRSICCLTKSKLVKAYCTSFYGVELWDLSHRDIESLCVAWRKGIRRIWQIPNTTHSVLLPFLCNTIPPLDLFYKRMLSFMHRCLNSQSLIVAFVARHAILHGAGESIMGRNIVNCALRYNVSQDDILTMMFSPYDIDKRYTQDENACNTATLLFELLQCRDGNLRLSSNNFDRFDIANMIELLCTH